MIGPILAHSFVPASSFLPECAISTPFSGRLSPLSTEFTSLLLFFSLLSNAEGLPSGVQLAHPTFVDNP